MVKNVITLRIDDNTSDLIDMLIKLKLARNKGDALRWIMQVSIKGAKELIERKEKGQALVKEWKERGFPELPPELSNISIYERY